MLDFKCPKCSAEMEVEADWDGMEAECQACGEDIIITINRQTSISPVTEAEVEVEPESEPEPISNLEQVSDITGPLEFSRVKIPAGEFSMGCDMDDLVDFYEKTEGMVSPGSFDGERPSHKVILDEFEIDKYPVTCGQYAEFCEETFHNPPDYWEGDTPPEHLLEHPVVYVSMADAMAYCKWAGGRLPYETEWEKAARGEDGRSYPWGNEFDETKCNADKYDGQRTTVAVNKYPAGASPYGCMDMAGNVQEWTFDSLTPYPGYKKQQWIVNKVALDLTRYDSEGSVNHPVFWTTYSTVRGGSFGTLKSLCRTSSRLPVPGDAELPDVGFRCVYGTDPNEIGQGLINNGDFKGALKYFKKALQITPCHTAVLFNAAYCYQNAGQFQTGAELWQRLLETWPNDFDAQAMLQECLDNGAELKDAEIDETEEDDEAAESSEISLHESVDLLNDDSSGDDENECRQEIHEAIEDGDIELVRSIIKNHPGVLEMKLEGALPIHTALDMGASENDNHLEVAKLLLPARENISCLNEAGITPLHLNSMIGNKEMAGILISHGADLNISNPNDGSTPLHLAAMQGKSELVDFLIEKGAEINARDKKYGITALHFAAVQEHLETIKVLLEQGADLKIKDNEGRTPEALAKEHSRFDSIKVLKKGPKGKGNKLNLELNHDVETTESLSSPVPGYENTDSIKEFARKAVKHKAVINTELTQLSNLMDALREEQKKIYSDLEMEEIGAQLDDAFEFFCPKCGKLDSLCIITGAVVSAMQDMNPQMATTFGGPNIANSASGKCPSCQERKVHITFDPQKIKIVSSVNENTDFDLDYAESENQENCVDSNHQFTQTELKDVALKLVELIEKLKIFKNKKKGSLEAWCAGCGTGCGSFCLIGIICSFFIFTNTQKSLDTALYISAPLAVLVFAFCMVKYSSAKKNHYKQMDQICSDLRKSHPEIIKFFQIPKSETLKRRFLYHPVNDSLKKIFAACPELKSDTDLQPIWSQIVQKKKQTEQNRNQKVEQYNKNGAKLGQSNQVEQTQSQGKVSVETLLKHISNLEIGDHDPSFGPMQPMFRETNYLQYEDSPQDAAKNLQELLTPYNDTLKAELKCHHDHIEIEHVGKESGTLWKRYIALKQRENSFVIYMSWSR